MIYPLTAIHLSDQLIAEAVAAAIDEAPFMVATRREIHSHPELGFEETQTSALIANELRSLGYEVETEFGGTGVVGTLDPDGSGPTLLVRFDIDALPVEETTGAEYASTVQGVSHACGHDGHVAIGLALARLLVRFRSRLQGSPRLAFQPAEELLEGARRMVADGVHERRPPELSLALHLWNGRAVGWFGSSAGAVTAGADSFRILVRGKGGHAAHPHQTRDPVVAAAHIVIALQSAVARNLEPSTAGVLSITRVEGGRASNLIPETVELSGTIRSREPEVRLVLIERLESIAHKIAEGLSCVAHVDVVPLTEPVVNDSQLADLIAEVATRAFPDSEVDRSIKSMASEDFGVLAAESRSCYFLVGSAPLPLEMAAPHHDGNFDIDERSMTNGVALLLLAVLALIGTDPVTIPDR